MKVKNKLAAIVAILMGIVLPNTALKAGDGPNDPVIKTDKSTYYVGDKVTVTVSNIKNNGSIKVWYCLLESRYAATNPQKKWQMNVTSNSIHWFGPMSDAWANKCLKIIAENTATGTWSNEIYWPIQAKPQTKQTLTKPQWVQELPTNVIANQDYTISWKPVANAQKYKVYFTQGGSQAGWDYEPTSPSKTVKIPDKQGTVYIGIIAVPDYNQYNQSEELQKAFSVWRLESINKDRWTDHNKNITVYNDWNLSNRKSVGTIPKGTKVSVRDKFTLNANESYALIWTYNKEQGNYSGNMYVNVNDLREAAPQSTYTTQAINDYRWINVTTANVYNDLNLTNQKTTLSKDTKVYVTVKYIFSNGNQVVKINEGYVNASDLGTADPSSIDFNRISYVYIVNYSKGTAINAGHNFILFEDRNGNGTVYSYGPVNSLTGVVKSPARMYEGTFSKNDFRECLNKKIFNLKAYKIENGRKSCYKNNVDEPFDRYAKFSVNESAGREMLWFAEQYLNNYPDYGVFYGGEQVDQCDDMTSRTIGAGQLSSMSYKNGMGYFVAPTPNGSFCNILSTWNAIIVEREKHRGPSCGEDFIPIKDYRWINKNTTIYSTFTLKSIDKIDVGTKVWTEFKYIMGNGKEYAYISYNNNSKEGYVFADDLNRVAPNQSQSNIQTQTIPASTTPIAQPQLANQKNTQPNNATGRHNQQQVSYNHQDRNNEQRRNYQQDGTNFQQQQTYNTSNFTKTGNSALRSDNGRSYYGDINASSGFRFTVNSSTAKTVNFGIVYRTDPNRGGRLIVNGSTQNIMFEKTGWSSWQTKTVQVSLRQGTNTIEFYGGYPTNNDWAPDIAEITIK